MSLQESRAADASADAFYRPMGLTEKLRWLKETTCLQDLSSSAKLVAQVLALNFHDNETGRCDPPLETIANAAGICLRSVNSAIAELERTGKLEILHGRRRGYRRQDVNRYRFARSTSAQSLHPGKRAPTSAQKMHAGACQSAKNGAQPSAESAQKPLEPLSDADASGSARAARPAAVFRLDVRTGANNRQRLIFGKCLEYLLLEHPEETEKSLRSLLGKWRKEFGDDAVLEVIEVAYREQPTGAKAWIAGALTHRGRAPPKRSRGSLAEAAADVRAAFNRHQTKGA